MKEIKIPYWFKFKRIRKLFKIDEYSYGIDLETNKVVEILRNYKNESTYGGGSSFVFNLQDTYTKQQELDISFNLLSLSYIGEFKKVNVGNKFNGYKKDFYFVMDARSNSETYVKQAYRLKEEGDKKWEKR